MRTPFPVEPTTYTVRERIMRKLVEVFTAPLDPDPPPDPRIVWGVVTRKAITKQMVSDETYVLGIYDTLERIREGTGYDLRTLRVVMEFHVRLAEGDESPTYLTHCLGQIMDRIRPDITLGGLVLNIREDGSELDIDGAFDKYASGVIAFDVTYRTRANDPYTQV